MIALAVTLALAAAGAAAPLRVVTTTPDLAAIARELGGEAAKVECLASGVANPHFVDAKPSFMVKLMKADLFIQTGLELEVGWAPLLLQGARNPRILPGTPGFLEASWAITPLEAPQSPTRAMGDVHAGGNPHFMADPDSALAVARLVAKKMGELAPGQAESFAGNLAGFEGRLREAQRRWDKALGPHRGAKYVSYHRDWIYFGRRFGLVSAGEIEPKPGIPPTPAHTGRIIETIKNEGVRMVFTDPWYERRTPESIARESGARLLTMAVMPEAVPEAAGYFAWMDYNVRQVAEALAAPAGGGR